MAKPKKETIDELDLELLSALYYLKQATATDLEKELKGEITKAGISKRLKWLAEKGYLEEPEVDISADKLKKIYKAPNRDKLKTVFLEWYQAEIYEPITKKFVAEASKEEQYTLEEAYSDYPLGKAYEDDRILMLSRLSLKDLEELRKGISLKEAIEILEGYSELFSYEIAGLVTVEDEIVKLTDKGLKAVLEKKIEAMTKELTKLKELDKEAYQKLLAKFCKDLS